MLYKHLILLIVICFICGCGPNNISSNTESSDPIVEIIEPVGSDTLLNGDRNIWQKPHIVIEKLGNISDKVVADLGAGLGYFSFKLAPYAQKVIAIDIDTQMVNFIEKNKNKYLGKDAQKLEGRIAHPQDPNLLVNEVDVIIIINTIAYLPQLDEYLKNIKYSLKPDGELLIVDYKMKKLPISSPPKEERIYLDHLENLLEKHNFILLESDDTSLDYQYIIKAKNNK